MSTGFHAEGFPIYQTATARAANPEYFQHFGSTQAGTTKAILGHVVAHRRRQVSFMIVRRSHREPRTAMHMQTVHTGSRGYVRAPRTVYNTTRATYVIVEQRWSDGFVKELSVYDTPEQARAAFKLLTRRSSTGSQRTIEAGKAPSFDEIASD